MLAPLIGTRRVLRLATRSSASPAGTVAACGAADRGRFPGAMEVEVHAWLARRTNIRRSPGERSCRRWGHVVFSSF